MPNLKRLCSIRSSGLCIMMSVIEAEPFAFKGGAERQGLQFEKFTEPAFYF